MSRAEHTVDIARPPAAVFRYLVEPELMKRWIGGLDEFTPLDDRPGVGARSRQKVEQAGRKWDVESEIVELVPDERLRVRAEASMFTSEIAYSLATAAATTRLTATVETAVRGMGGRLLSGVTDRVAERKLVSDLERLKRLVEQSV